MTNPNVEKLLFIYTNNKLLDGQADPKCFFTHEEVGKAAPVSAGETEGGDEDENLYAED